MNFTELAERLETISQLSSRNQITQELSQLFTDLPAEEAKEVAYLLLGDLYPSYKSSKFGVAEKQMLSFLQVYFEQKGKSSEEVDHFLALAKQSGDLGQAYYEFLGQESAKEVLTVAQVYQELERIMETTGTGSTEKKQSLLLKLLTKLDAVSGKIVIRIVLSKLRLGFSAMTILDALSVFLVGDKTAKKDLEAAYNVSADIGLLAEVAAEQGLEGINAFKPQPGVPIRPAAAERLKTPADIIAKLGSCAVQPKIDGLRLQAHKFKNPETGQDEIKLFSRNMLDISYMFPDISAELLGVEHNNFIVEGEVIAYNPSTHTFLAFQETSKRRRKHDLSEGVEELPVQLFLFDLLYFKDTSFLPEVHTTRRSMLEAHFSTDSHQVAVIEEKPIQAEQPAVAAEELTEYFHQVIDQGHEGVVVKRLGADYKAGKRNFNWIKLKYLEKGGLGDSIDCVILGYYGGKGRRASFNIGALLVGVYNDKNQTFESVAKVGTGLTDQQWQDIRIELEKNVIDKKPEQVAVAQELEPDVWVEPKVVISVEADEISFSPLHSAGRTAEKRGLALRFPRLVAFRFDKAAIDVTTVNELMQLFQQSKQV